MDVEIEAGCTPVDGGWMCGPGGFTARDHRTCPECKARHRFVVRYPNCAYYGTDEHGECGDSFQMSEGWRATRPFERGWRAKAQARFEDMWSKAAPEGTQPIYSPDGIYMRGVRMPDGTEVIHEQEGEATP